jgi:hypothetical protein
LGPGCGVGKNMIARAAFAFAVILCFSWSVQATSIQAYTSADLIAAADLVVLGQALKIVATRDQKGRVFRAVAFQVDEFVVGTGPSRITVNLYGGTMDGVVSVVSGAAELSVGAPLILFLRKSTAGDHYSVVGLDQGRFEVKADPKTKQRCVTRRIQKGLRLRKEASGDSLGLGRSDISFYMALEKFIAEIKRLAGSEQTGK